MKIIRLIILFCYVLVSFSAQGALFCKVADNFLRVDYNHAPDYYCDDTLYAKGLLTWKPSHAIGIRNVSLDVAKELVMLPADGGLSNLEREYTPFSSRLNEFYGDNPPVVQDVMRDLIFLDWLQDEIKSWEKDYFFLEKVDSDGFSKYYQKAKKIITAYQAYLEKRNIPSVFGTIFLSSLEGTIDGAIKGKVKEIIGHQFLSTGYSVELNGLINDSYTGLVKDVVTGLIKESVGKSNAIFVDFLTKFTSALL